MKWYMGQKCIIAEDGIKKDSLEQELNSTVKLIFIQATLA